MKASATRLAAVGNAFVIAVGTLWAHKLRSILTVFGIVIGIASVVLAGAILLSVRDLAVKSNAQSFGANTFIVSQVAYVGVAQPASVSISQQIVSQFSCVIRCATGT